MYQSALFYFEDIFDKPLRRYELFFSLFDLILLEKNPAIGRKPISRASLLRILIFKNLHCIVTLSDLSTDLYERPWFVSILYFEHGLIELEFIRGKYLWLTRALLKPMSERIT